MLLSPEADEPEEDNKTLGFWVHAKGYTASVAILVGLVRAAKMLSSPFSVYLMSMGHKEKWGVTNESSRTLSVDERRFFFVFFFNFTC